MRRWLALSAATTAMACGPATAEGVALTFDDLPTLQLGDSTAYAARTTQALLKRLRRHRLPAIGFVVGDKLEGDDHAQRVDLLKAWLRAGQTLGNHTYDHESLNKTPLADYIDNVRLDDAVLRPLLGARPKVLWFRHPFLETGPTVQTKRGFETWLKQHGYRVAPVTLENSDWMFALPYDDAVMRHDAAAVRRIRRAYVDYTAAVVPWYRKAARQLLGRRPPLVFLLHASRLNADTLEDLVAILRRNGLRPVSLERAMRDRAYAIPDDRPDAAGDEWLSRWSELLHKPLPWRSFPKPPADIEALDMKLDSDP